MSDELLQQMAERLREQRSDALHDARLEALARGELDEAEREALREELGDVVAAFEPLGDEFTEALARQCGELVAGSGGEEADAAQPTGADAPTEGRVVELSRRAEGRRRARGWKTWVAWAAPMAVAAAAAWFFVVPRGGQPGGPMAPWELSFRGGEKAVRGSHSPEGIPVLTPQSHFELVVRPERAVEGAVDLRAVAVRVAPQRSGAKAVPLDWRWQRAPGGGGAARVSGRAGELLRLPPGRWRIVVFVGRPDALPKDRESLERLARNGAPEGPGWRRLETTVEVRPGT